MPNERNVVRRLPTRIALVVSCCAALTLVGHAQGPGTYRQKVRTFHSPEEFKQLTRGKVRLERRLTSIAPREHPRGLPVESVNVIAVESPSVAWFGTRAGAIRFNRASSSLEYFYGRRWLPADDVTGIGFEGNAAWLETPKGLARIEYRPMTLEEKSVRFVERVQARHVRWGLTADSHLKAAGDLSTNQMVSTDNDGLWTAIYVAAECFRYKVTGQPDARANARAGMRAIARLEAITGIPGFPARSFIKVGEDVQPPDGAWRDTPGGVWRWKGDTSSDEIAGHYFVYALYYDLAADEDEKPALRAAIERITTHILDNNYQLIDVDGRRTRWGWWGPDAIWDDPDETGLRALLILAHLRVALHMTTAPHSRARFQAAYDDLVGTHKYHLLTRNQKVMVPGAVNHSDDELAFLAYYPLLKYEANPMLRAVYTASLERSWRIERPERNPLWNFIYAAGTGASEFDRAESLRTLQEIPMDQIKWDVRNSHRHDVPMDPIGDRFKRRQALVVLPYDELPLWKWNANPYNLDASDSGRGEGDGAYFLLPYWMGRYHGLIER
jgi:hypothetical protein